MMNRPLVKPTKPLDSGVSDPAPEAGIHLFPGPGGQFLTLCRVREDSKNRRSGATELGSAAFGLIFETYHEFGEEAMFGENWALQIVNQGDAFDFPIRRAIERVVCTCFEAPFSEKRLVSTGISTARPAAIALYESKPIEGGQSITHTS